MAKDNWFERYQREEMARKEKAEQELSYYCGFLRKLGISTIIVDFDGSGDEGETTDARPNHKPKAGFPVGMLEAIGASMRELLPGGWEINSGSSGALVLNVQSGQCDCKIEFREDDEFDSEWE